MAIEIKKEDQPKLIIMGVLFLGALGYGGYTLMTPTTTQAATGVRHNSAPMTVAAAGTPASSPAVLAIANMPLDPTGKDPFLPNGPAAPQPEKPVTTPAPKIETAKAELPKLPFAGKHLPGGPPNWSEPGGGAASGLLPPAALQPPPPPAYTVTGVVRGDTDVAVLRGGPGGSERRFVRVGDPVTGGFKVVAVRTDGVDIASGDRRITLKLGGDSRAK